MTASEANALIDNVCDKLNLGIQSASEMVPKLAKYKIVMGSIALGGNILLLGICIWLVYAGIKAIISKEPKGIYDRIYAKGLDFLCIIFGVFLGFIILVITFECMNGLVGWIYVPEVKTINEILGQ